MAEQKYVILDLDSFPKLEDWSRVIRVVRETAAHLAMFRIGPMATLHYGVKPLCSAIKEQGGKVLYDGRFLCDWRWMGSIALAISPYVDFFSISAASGVPACSEANSISNRKAVLCGDLDLTVPIVRETGINLVIRDCYSDRWPQLTQFVQIKAESECGPYRLAAVAAKAISSGARYVIIGSDYDHGDILKVSERINRISEQVVVCLKDKATPEQAAAASV